MKKLTNELSSVCEHCGNLNRSGALHCDLCGKGLSANLAAKYREYTRKARNCFILCGVSAILAVVLTIAAGESSSVILAFLSFLAYGSVLIFIFCCIKFFLERGNYKYSENIELALDGKPEEEINAHLPANYSSCPSCGNTYNKKKEAICKYCGCDLKNQTGETGKSRLNDEDLLKNMGRYQARAKAFLISSLPFLIAAIIALNITGQEFSVYSLVGIVLIIVFFVLIAKSITSGNTAREMFKVNVVRDALAEVIDGCIYRSNLSISKQRIEATGLFGGWNKFRGNDYIRGMYKGHQIEFSDIHLEEEYETGSGKNEHTVTRTIFEGQWMTCRLSKKLPAAVRLREDLGKGNAETENMVFNKKYQIDTDDPHYMFYVLTPHFMEYIVAADEEAKARTFFYFAGDTAHIAVYNRRDAFEIPTNSTARSNPSIAREQIKSEMKYITDILDELLLNDKLF